MRKNNFKKIALGLMLLCSPVLAANKLPYLTGLYARTTSNQYILDTDYSLETRTMFKQHVLKYQPNAVFEEIQVTNPNYEEGKQKFMYNATFSGNAGYTLFAGETVIDVSSRTIIYSSAVIICADILDVLIHEWTHSYGGLAHEECNQKWIQYQGIWRNTQQYEYGNLLACGIMAYGSKSFTPVDDWDTRRVSGQVVQKGRVKGTITVNGCPLKGANLIFISQTKTFMPTWRVLKQRFSTIVDILGDGDGSFEIELPPDTYQVMLVPIGDYDKDTHGVWRLADSQIKDITEPLFLNGKRTRLIQDPATKGIVQVGNGMDLTFNWSVGL